VAASLSLGCIFPAASVLINTATALAKSGPAGGYEDVESEKGPIHDLVRSLGVAQLLSRRFCPSGLLAELSPPAIGHVGLVAWGRKFQDLVLGNNGTVVGGVTFGAGMVGQAFHFDGTSGSVNVTNAGGYLDLGSNLTIDFWMKADPTNPMNSCCQGLVTTEWYGIEVDTNQGPTSNVDFFTHATPRSSGLLLQPGVWYHVAGTYDGASTQYYVNGQLISQTVVSGPNPPMGSSAFLSIGSETRARSVCR